MAQSADVSLAGILIEYTSNTDNQPYWFDLAVERIKAASAKAKSLSNNIVLVACSDGFMHDIYDLDERITKRQKT